MLVLWLDRRGAAEEEEVEGPATAPPPAAPLAPSWARDSSLASTAIKLLDRRLTISHAQITSL